MEKSKKFTLFGIISLFALIALRSTEFYGTITGAAPINRVLQFSGPLVLCSFIFPAFLHGNKYLKTVLFTALSYIIWAVIYCVVQNGLNFQPFFDTFFIGAQTRYMYIGYVALQILIIMPILTIIYKKFPIALITFSLIWTFFFQYSYITGTIIYYKIDMFIYMNAYFHFWLIYPVIGMFIADKFEKITSNKKMLYISGAGFVVCEIIVYLESILKNWGWTFIRPSIIFLTFFAAILLCYLVEYLSNIKIILKLTNALEHSFCQMYYSFCLSFMLINSVLKYRGGIIGFFINTILAIILTTGYGIVVTSVKKLLHPANKTHTLPSEADQ